jgi:hypothetical protein
VHVVSEAPGEPGQPRQPDAVVTDAVETDAVVADAVATDAPEATPASGMPRKRSRKGLVIALVLVSLLAVGLAGLSAYLWSVHSQYVSQNEQLRDDASSLGTDLASAQAEAEDVQAQLDDTTAQLEEAKATINGLANSEAQAGDDRQALIDVADGLQQCANARQDLIDHLNESYKWTAASLKASEASITKYCNRVMKQYKEVVGD